MNRRDFLKLMGLGAVGVVIAPYLPPLAPAPQVAWVAEFDAFLSADSVQPAMVFGTEEALRKLGAAYERMLMYGSPPHENCRSYVGLEGAINTCA